MNQHPLWCGWGCGTVQLWSNRLGCSSKRWVFCDPEIPLLGTSRHKYTCASYLAVAVIGYPGKITFGEKGLTRTCGFRGDGAHCDKKVWMQEGDTGLTIMEQLITFRPHTGCSKSQVPPSSFSITLPKSVTNWGPSVQIHAPTGGLYAPKPQQHKSTRKLHTSVTATILIIGQIWKRIRKQKIKYKVIVSLSNNKG